MYIIRYNLIRTDTQIVFKKKIMQNNSLLKLFFLSDWPPYYFILPISASRIIVKKPNRQSNIVVKYKVEIPWRHPLGEYDADVFLYEDNYLNMSPSHSSCEFSKRCCVKRYRYEVYSVA